ncbi:hypothetical protein GOC23_18635 [Sinorhizobium meliloti]|nr:hypothetical protein [Sinorhizobium meliloti]
MRAENRAHFSSSRSTAPRVLSDAQGRCSTLICCMFLSFNRIRLKDTCSRIREDLPANKKPGSDPGFFP